MFAVNTERVFKLRMCIISDADSLRLDPETHRHPVCQPLVIGLQAVSQEGHMDFIQPPCEGL